MFHVLGFRRNEGEGTEYREDDNIVKIVPVSRVPHWIHGPVGDKNKTSLTVKKYGIPRRGICRLENQNANDTKYTAGT